MRQVHANGLTIGRLIQLIQKQGAFQLININPSGSYGLYLEFWAGDDFITFDTGDLIDALQTALDKVIAYKAGDKTGWENKAKFKPVEPINDDLEDCKCSILK